MSRVKAGALPKDQSQVLRMDHNGCLDILPLAGVCAQDHLFFIMIMVVTWCE